LAGNLGAIPSPAAVAQHGANYGTSPETTVGAGPFLLKEWVRNSQIVLARNPNYWQKGLPYLDTLTFKTIADQNTMADALTTNTLDIGFISTAPDIAKRLEEQGMEFSRTTSPDAAGMTFNMSRPPFDDVRVRRAFILATDAKDVIQKALNGIATPANGPGVAYYPEDHPLYDKSVTQKTNDLAEAQKLIDAYVAEKGQINTTATIPAGVRTDFGNALVQNWNRLKGVNVVADLQTPTQAILLFSQGNFAIRVATVSGYEYVDQAASFYQTGSPQNVSKYSNPKMDALLKEGFAATSVDDRKKYLNDLAKLVIEDAHSVRIYFSEFNTFYQDDVGVESTFGPSGFPDPTTLWTES
jgi:ABC-type transport system substrate-binding protein